MKLSVISGSGRPESQTAKVGQFLAEMSKSLGFNEVYHLDLGSNSLPIWSQEFAEAKTSNGDTFDSIKKELESSEAFIVMTPEWHGMATPIIKNFFLYFTGSGVFDHKPALPVSVSAGRGGAYPIAELRMSSYKNAHLCYIPEHLIVREVTTTFNSANPENDGDEYIRKRSKFAIELLREYAKGLGPVRSSGLNFSDYTNGM